MVPGLDPFPKYGAFGPGFAFGAFHRNGTDQLKTCDARDPKPLARRLRMQGIFQNRADPKVKRLSKPRPELVGVRMIRGYFSSITRGRPRICVQKQETLDVVQTHTKHPETTVNRTNENQSGGISHVRTNRNKRRAIGWRGSYPKNNGGVAPLKRPQTPRSSRNGLQTGSLSPTIGAVLCSRHNLGRGSGDSNRLPVRHPFNSGSSRSEQFELEMCRLSRRFRSQSVGVKTRFQAPPANF